MADFPIEYLVDRHAHCHISRFNIEAVPSNFFLDIRAESSQISENSLLYLMCIYFIEAKKPNQMHYWLLGPLFQESYENLVISPMQLIIESEICVSTTSYIVHVKTLSTVSTKISKKRINNAWPGNVCRWPYNQLMDK
jgi:hypothetical protein